MMNLMVGFEQNNQFTPTHSTPIASPQFITRLHVHNLWGVWDRRRLHS